MTSQQKSIDFIRLSCLKIESTKSMTKYQELNSRILVDIDNERRYDCDIVGLSQTDEATDFNGNTVILKEGNYIHTYTENYEKGEGLSFIFAEGYVIQSPYSDLHYKWCCKIQGEIEYSEDYNKRFKRD